MNFSHCDVLLTLLLQGDVIPTVGGGRQVVFNDVEVLTQVTLLNLTQQLDLCQQFKISWDQFNSIKITLNQFLSILVCSSLIKSTTIY